jgi:pyroglutamyl-peptidase
MNIGSLFRINVASVIKNIKSDLIPAASSRWSGNNLCNQILYHGLHHAKMTGKDILCGFAHLPALPEQVISQWPDVPFMPLEMMRKAIEIAVRNLVYQHERGHT